MSDQDLLVKDQFKAISMCRRALKYYAGMDDGKEFVAQTALDDLDDLFGPEERKDPLPWLKSVKFVE